MSIFGFDALFSLMVLVWVMISVVTLGLIVRYFALRTTGGKVLYKKAFGFNFGVGLTFMYLFIFVKQIVGFLQTNSGYILFIAVGFFFLTIYMIIQSTNEFLIYEKGMSHNMSYIHWHDVKDYQIADKGKQTVFKIMTNRKNILLKQVEKPVLISVTKQQGVEIKKLLKAHVKL